MATPDQIRRWAGTTRPRDWYGFCAGLTYNTIAENGGVVPDGPYGSAYQAYQSTVIASRDASAAPPGAIHYWDYYGRDGNGRVNRWGHVAVDIEGGGHSILSATGHAREWWAVNAGIISVAAQTARGMPYLGWSYTYGRRNRITITVPGTAGGGATPFDPVEDDMNDDQDGRLKSVESLVKGLDTRRDTAIVWVNGRAWVVDHAAGTKWDAARGQSTIEEAFAYIAWLRALGFTEYQKQAPFTLAGYRDITNEGDLNEEVLAGVREAVQSGIHVPDIVLTDEQLEALVATTGATTREEAEKTRQAFRSIVLTVQ